MTFDLIVGSLVILAAFWITIAISTYSAWQEREHLEQDYPEPSHVRIYPRPFDWERD